MDFKETAEAISLHGLGFIQVKLQGAQRLHVWHPCLPRRACRQFSSIHDHRFGFESRVLVGELVNVTYAALTSDVAPQTTHISYLHEGERTPFGNRPWIADEALCVVEVARELVGPGASYRMLPFVYHRSEPVTPNGVATIMTKTVELGRGAHSLCEKGVRPDADFNRFQCSEKELWQVVAAVLGGETRA